METIPKKSLLRNLFFSALSRGSEVIFLLLLILAARFLGDEAYGQFSFALAFASIFEVATDLGLKQYIIREISRERDKTAVIAGNSLSLKVVLSLGTLVLIGGIILVFPIGTDLRIAVCLMTISMVFKSFKFLFRSVMIGNEQFELETVLVSIERLLFLVFGSLILLLGYGLIPFTGTFAIISFVNMLLSAYLVKRKICHVKFLKNPQLIKVIVRGSIPFCLAIAGLNLYFRVDSIMIAYLRSDSEVGWYNAAYRITQGLIVFPSIIYYVFLPRLSVLHNISKELVENLTKKGCKYCIALSIPIILFGVFSAENFILLIYGEEYINSVLAFQILLFAIVFMFIWNIFISVLNAINYAKIPFWGISIGLAVNVFLNMLMIPTYGYLGACVSTVISEIVLFACLLHKLSLLGYKFELLKISIKPIVASIIPLALLVLFRDISTFSVMFAGSSVYLVSLVVLRFFDSEEINLFFNFKKSFIARV